MNITSNAGLPEKSDSETVWLSVFTKEKSGACVPSGSIVLAVLTTVRILYWSVLEDPALRIVFNNTVILFFWNLDDKPSDSNS